MDTQIDPQGICTGADWDWCPGRGQQPNGTGWLPAAFAGRRGIPPDILRFRIGVWFGREGIVSQSLLHELIIAEIPAHATSRQAVGMHPQTLLRGLSLASATPTQLQRIKTTNITWGLALDSQPSFRTFGVPIPIMPPASSPRPIIRRKSVISCSGRDRTRSGASHMASTVRPMRVHRQHLK